MARRKALDIKKEILKILKREGELSLRELDIKVDTNSHTIRTQIEELEFFDRVIVTKYPKNENNGRPYTTVRIR